MRRLVLSSISFLASLFILLSVRVQAETAVELYPCFSMDEDEDECPLGQDAAGRLQDENPGCEVSDVAFSGQAQRECCYDFTAGDCEGLGRGCGG